MHPLVRAACIFALLCWQQGLHAACEKPDAVTPDGGRYCGPLVANKLHGRGRLAWSNGDVYEGDFADGRMSGNGRLSFAGDVYRGRFRAGRMHGHGTLRTSDGSVYTGAFQDDRYQGQGRHKLPTGEEYVGSFAKGYYHGKGQFTGKGYVYRGDFRHGLYSGAGETAFDDGAKHNGGYALGLYNGMGSFENAHGERYEGQFKDGEFTGNGTRTRRDGGRHDGSFLKWQAHGEGRYADPAGNSYEGNFVNGELDGPARLAGVDKSVYEGEFRQWRFHGQGVLRMANGDVYQGGFAHGLYDGQGTLTYAKPRDGRSEERGAWRYGQFEYEKRQQLVSQNVETALYSQRALLDRAISSLAPREPGRINLYLLAVAGDGSQEVFRREVDFVREQFERRFGTQGRSLALINSRNTPGSAPMATIASIRESVMAIADRMERETDILFVMLTSHGSKQYDLSLGQEGMQLRDLPARELATILKDSGIRWKVVVVSACYGGGFIAPLQDDQTLVIAAARHDRQSFGCADENEFTYFGRAFFKEALPASGSFQDAFRKAEALVAEWEAKGSKEMPKAGPEALSLPQMHNPAAIEQHLGRWWSQLQKNTGGR